MLFKYSEFLIGCQKYNVVRKLPVIGHNDRVLAIDGDYIHVSEILDEGFALTLFTR